MLSRKSETTQTTGAWGSLRSPGLGFFASGLVDSGLVDQKALSVISLFAAAAAIYFDLKSHLTDYGKTIAEQSVSARTFLALRDETLDLLTALHFDEVDSSEAAEVLATIEAAYAKACQDAPRTTGKAVEQAGRALKGGEETYTEDEIDRLLPEYLRRGK